MRNTCFFLLFSAVVFVPLLTSAQHSIENWKDLNQKGLTLYNQGRYEQALPLWERAIVRALNEFGKGHMNYVYSLQNLAAVYAAVGNYRKAEPLNLEAREICSKILGKEHPDYATTLNQLLALYLYMGNYAKAEPLALEAKEIRERVLGKTHQDYASSACNLATLYYYMGNYSKAEPLYQEAINFFSITVGKENHQYATAVNALGTLYKATHKYSKAEPLYLEAKEIRAKLLGTEHPDYATSVHNLASMYTQQGIYTKAEPLFNEAIEIRSKALGKEHPDYLLSVHNLATLYSQTLNYSKAEPLLLETIESTKKIFGENNPNHIYSLYGLAMLYWKKGDRVKAESFFLETISNKQQEILYNFPSLSEKEKQNYVNSNRFYFSEFETFCLEIYSENPSILTHMFNHRLVTKGLLFNASNKIRQRILSSGNQSLINSFGEWQSKRDFLAKVYQMPLVEREKKGINEKLLEDEANAIEKKLSLQSALFGIAADKKQYTWEEIRQKLKDGEAAIEMVKGVKNVNNKKITIYAALIVTQQSKKHPELVVLENGYDLDHKLRNYYRNAINQKIKDEVSYHQFWEPISKKLTGIKKVYFSAEGVYNQINLNTLYNSATGKYVIDEIEVQLIASTKDLITRSNSTPSGIKDVILFGYPNYNNNTGNVQNDTTNATEFGLILNQKIRTDSSQRFFNGEEITELPGTKLEVQSIASMLKTKNIPVREFLSNEASEMQIKRLNNPNVLHIATHGFFLSNLPSPKETALAFAGIQTKKIAENPLLRSGLLFAGAKGAFTKNKTSTEHATEDGILTAYEAMNLDLDQTDLVVLSACETGLGVTSNGEGVYGLQRALQVAGAKSVLMSLWTVSDDATQKLMTLFYESWLTGKTPQDSFRLAQMLLREKYPEPHYWGAFVMVGN